MPKNKTKSKRIKAVSQKVKLFRAKEPLISVFMWGINSTINELTHVNIPPMLMPDDFKAYNKIKIDRQYFNKDNMPSHFKVKEYCPLVFRNLRERFRVTDSQYMLSLTGSEPVMKEDSGSTYYLTGDKRFIIKTLTREEVEEMHHILKHYHEYVVEYHSKTLLPQYFGAYRLTVEKQESYVVVMRNVFSHPLRVHRKYDLKGSTVQREASEKEKSKELPTFKDNDFVSEGHKMYIGNENKAELLEIIRRDVEFLSKNNLMDYRLLLGVHDADQGGNASGVDDESEETGGETDSVNSDNSPPESPGIVNSENKDPNAPSLFAHPVEIISIPSSDNAPKKSIYFVAIIDILTHYGMKKRTAQAAKTVKHGSHAQISTIPPDQYAKRFLDFMENIIV
ncbi:phosphatidylinositol 5-phosphate 4-kinase type-2 alpha-like [Paramacrobiotus metropolitanus]|uniref:phosphatidylinositol 5-phosphate 4-kinase type-2 alpha-like n=1 Tax=Paramacrobiotus metropolitanus TaxID=2943436 RepID=UPI002445F31D|nr:phosphatidylinositol 5-phosphate 4-kinase type-2 alpha-like [Paramacrobiotus metropolitanus]